MALARPWEGREEEAHGEGIVQVPQRIYEGWVPAPAQEEKGESHPARVHHKLLGLVEISRGKRTGHHGAPCMSPPKLVTHRDGVSLLSTRELAVTQGPLSSSPGSQEAPRARGWQHPRLQAGVNKF